MSHATDAAIGMMDGAYFTSRKEILDFLNNLLDLNLTKIEQTASGAVACQLTEYLFPNSIPMSRVDWGAKASHEYVANYKLLQSAFNKNKIQKHIDVDKLIRGKYQDNLEFCQWLKAFFDQTSPMMSRGRDGYDPVAVRAKGKGGKNVERSKGGGGRANATGSAKPFATRGVTGSTAVTKAVSSSVSATRPPSSSSNASRKENIANTSSADSALPYKLRKQPSSNEDSSAIRALKEENRQLKSENVDLQSKCAELEENVAEIELSLQTVESERNFYFDKLRGIEIMLQVFKEKEESGEGIDLGIEARKVIERAFKVMYATEEDHVEVDDEGNLVGDITIENSVQGASSLDPRAQDELEEEEELLTSGIEDPVKTVEEHVTDAPLNQLSDDDLEDDELLTAGLDNGIPSQVDYVNHVPVANKPVLVDHYDDDSIDDENLLSD
eukprot:CCRYP_005048-RA/>CCRYP_005048-RA protein AED:0.16 eAED:0.16 QI:343/1/1/1/0.66/0.5/4/97/440